MYRLFKPINELRSYFLLKDIVKKLSTITDENRDEAHRIIKILFRLSKDDNRMSKRYRAYVCSVIKTLRNLYPYIPRNYKPLKERYDAAITLSQKIQIGDWVTIINDNWVEHQDYYRYNEYHLCETCDSSLPRCGKIVNIDHKYKYIDVQFGFDLTLSIINFYFGQFRFATKGEIKNAENKFKKRELDKINIQIEEHITKISELTTLKEKITNL